MKCLLINDSMKFKVSYSFPAILFILALISVFFLIEIQPFNYIIALIVFVIAGVMAWRIYYDYSSTQENKTEIEYKPSAKVTDLIKDSPKESKMKLDDFLKSSPKDLTKEFDFGEDLEKPVEKDGLDPFSDAFMEDEKYNAMKKKALKELKDVIKTKKKPQNKKI